MNATDTLGQFQAFLSIALELQNVAASLGLTIFQRIEQVFELLDAVLCLGLCLGFAGACRVLQFGTGFMQFFLCFAALFFQFGEQFFSISQGLRTSGFQMFEQAARKLLE